ncbi:MAG: cbb3-type cytochrome oxidase assembly protein CcoS [Leadbetterella sp.]|jgi:cbb3-type cytochrome oxidase maturation protein|nr:cbb3-type cytochrome oxidase assembly protein CcoS [Leadbetterella sp.]MBP8155971.1 cbb3-type cytochrome oxidase assembly protein CcoS [Leadbetterella sp.]
MEVIIILVILAILIAGSFLLAFFWATKDGQFDDTFSPSVRILIDNERDENKKH